LGPIGKFGWEADIRSSRLNVASAPNGHSTRLKYGLIRHQPSTSTFPSRSHVKEHIPWQWRALPNGRA